MWFSLTGERSENMLKQTKQKNETRNNNNFQSEAINL